MKLKKDQIKCVRESVYWFTVYGRHLDDCQWASDGACGCGFLDARKKVDVIVAVLAKQNPIKKVVLSG